VESILAAGFKMDFTALIRRVDTDLGEIGRLLLEAKRITSLPFPPEGVRGCKDCDVIDQIRAIKLA
jgi:hypothetical protein